MNALFVFFVLFFHVVNCKLYSVAVFVVSTDGKISSYDEERKKNVQSIAADGFLFSTKLSVLPSAFSKIIGEFRSKNAFAIDNCVFVMCITVFLRTLQ